MALDEPYRRALDGLPGVRSYRVLKPPSARADRSIDGRLKLRTEAGERAFAFQVYRSHLTRAATDHIIVASRRAAEPLLLFAPHIGAGLSEKLVAARLNYVDGHGNCHVSAPSLFIHIEGKTADPLPRADKGLRSAAYQVLFVYLAEQDTLDAPLRAVAELAGVSRQPVSDMKHRLLDEGYTFATKHAVRWHPHRRKDALGLWLHGYETVVRPSLIWGTYRTQDARPGDLENRLVRLLSDPKGRQFRWGGTAAGFRLARHYRGDITVVHLNEPPRDVQRHFRALADPNGNLVFMDAFGSINWQPEQETVHPLLAYSEMLHEQTERATEAARELYDRVLAPRWENGS